MSTGKDRSWLNQRELPFPVKNVSHRCAHHLIGKRPRPKNHQVPCIDTGGSQLDHRQILKTPTGDVLLNQPYGDESRQWAKSYADEYGLNYAAVADVDDLIHATIFWNKDTDLDVAAVIDELRTAYGV